MSEPRTIARYTIERALGYGATGIVYLAFDPSIERHVAIKVLRSDLDHAKADEIRQRFLREARAAGRLSHANIVTVYDVGEDSEVGAFIAMEYLPGTTLKQQLEPGARCQPLRACRLAVAVADAIDYAHREGVVHRDVKPANILLGDNGEVKITDFGMAGFDSSDLTVEGAILGTPSYMSPEQIAGRPADERSDVYSLGVILFELTTGTRPFTAASLPELSMSVTSRLPPDPSELCPTIPNALSRIILRCLEKSPEQRFQSGRELVHALSDVMNTLGDTGHSSGIDALPADTEGNRQPASRPQAPAALQTVCNDTEEPQPTEATVLASAGRRKRRIAAKRVIATRIISWSVAAVAVLVVVVLIGSAGDRGTPAREPSVSGIDAGAERGGPAAWTPASTPRPVASPVHHAPQSGQSTLVVRHKNRMTRAQISVWVDGNRVWTEEMTAPKNLFKRVKRVSGMQIEKRLPVSDGRHTVEVHISGKTMNVEARSSIEGDFADGGSRTLRAALNPYTDKLKLSWLD